MNNIESNAHLKPKISVIVPVYRNMDSLRQLYARLTGQFKADQTRNEIIFVNDASPDNSIMVLKEICREDPRVRALSFNQNHGRQMAVLTGLCVAKGDWMVVMDADLQDAPENIPGLVGKGEEGYAVVFGGPRTTYQSGFRMMTSRIFKTALSILTGIPRDAGSFVALRADAARDILQMRGPAPYINVMVGVSGFPVTSIPVNRSWRQSGESAFSTWGRSKYALRGVYWMLAYTVSKIFPDPNRLSYQEMCMRLLEQNREVGCPSESLLT